VLFGGVRLANQAFYAPTLSPMYYQKLPYLKEEILGPVAAV